MEYAPRTCCTPPPPLTLPPFHLQHHLGRRHHIRRATLAQLAPHMRDVLQELVSAREHGDLVQLHQLLGRHALQDLADGGDWRRV